MTSVSSVRPNRRQAFPPATAALSLSDIELTSRACMGIIDSLQGALVPSSTRSGPSSLTSHAGPSGSWKAEVSTCRFLCRDRTGRIPRVCPTVIPVRMIGSDGNCPARSSRARQSTYCRLQCSISQSTKTAIRFDSSSSKSGPSTTESTEK